MVRARRAKRADRRARGAERGSGSPLARRARRMARRRSRPRVPRARDDAVRGERPVRHGGASAAPHALAARDGTSPVAVVTSLRALLEHTIPPEELARRGRTLRAGDRLSWTETAAWLFDLGYEPVTEV